MQNGIIDEILRIEDEAEEITGNAEKRAGEIVRKAEEAARAGVADAVERARRSGGERILDEERKAGEAADGSDAELPPAAADGGACGRAVSRAVRRILEL